jgi:hypothetical protein
VANERVRANGEGTIYEEPLKRWASFVTFADGERREIRRDTAKQVSATIRELKSSSGASLK